MVDKRKVCAALVGYPNCGKTTIFNKLTRLFNMVGNWSGVTYKKHVGDCIFGDGVMELSDLPGFYSFDHTDIKSADDRVTFTDLVETGYDVIVNVINSSNIEQELYLTLQLFERTKLPIIVVLNMSDVAASKNINIDINKLAKALGTRCISMIASEGIGTEFLQKAIFDIAKKPINHTSRMKHISKDLIAKLRDKGFDVNSRDDIAQLLYSSGLFEEKRSELNSIIFEARYEYLGELLDDTVTIAYSNRKKLGEYLDQYLFLNNYLGIPCFLLIMYLFFNFSMVFGGVFQTLFEDLSNGFLHALPMKYALAFSVPRVIVSVCIGGVLSAIGIVLAFIPIIFCLYFFLSFLENSGYIARAAFVLDRLLRVLSISNKTFIPLLIGFGCNVPAIMMTRTVEEKRDRIMTIMMLPFMSCAARLTIYSLFCSVFFPQNGHNIVYALYLLGIFVAIGTALLLSSKQRVERRYFILEMPHFHFPAFSILFSKAYEKSKEFALGAGKTIVMIVFILSLFNEITLRSSGDDRDGADDRSILAEVATAVHPVFEPMGVKEDGWPAIVGLLTGVVAKEFVIAGLISGYKDTDSPDVTAIGVLSSSFERFIENLRAIPAELLPSMEVEDDLDRHYASYLRGLFDDDITAVIAYLIFILLYFPCVSVFATIMKELDIYWALLSAVWSTCIAYGFAVIFYQVSNLIHHGSCSITSLIAGVSVSVLSSSLVFVVSKRRGL